MSSDSPQRRHGVLVVVAALLVAASAAVGGVFGGPLLARQVTGADLAQWHAGNTPTPPPPVLVAADGQAAPPTAAGVSTALSALVGATGLGTHVGMSVVDVATGQQLYAMQPDAAMVPASVTKLVTGTAVLAARGPTYRIQTKAVAGPNPGDVVLVGGGDPTLSIGANGSYAGAARLDDLAAQVRTALGDAPPARVLYDGSLYSGAVTGPGWDPDAATGGFGSTITALMTDGARVNPRQSKGYAQRYPQPDIAAAQAFAKLLGLNAAAAVPGTAPSGAKELGKVESAPLLRIVETMMADSDNVVAEMLARQVALARNQPATWAGAVTAMRAVLEELGVPVAGYNLQDGSGLSRLDRLSPELLTALLTVAAKPDKPDLHGVFTGLPVGGYSGTLTTRYRNPNAGGSAAGDVRAKTGTLTGVSSIAGIVIDADGRTLAFALMADANKSTPAAVEALDRIVAALAACGCR